MAKFDRESPTTYETEKFKLLQRLYNLYGYTIKLNANKKCDKFWITCSEHKSGVKINNCDPLSLLITETEFSVKYPSVDQLCDYELLGHVAGQKSQSSKQQNGSNQLSEKYLGCQVPFWHKVCIQIEEHNLVLTGNPNALYTHPLFDWNWNPLKYMDVKEINAHHSQAVMNVFNNLPSMQDAKTLTSWDQLKAFLVKYHG